MKINICAWCEDEEHDLRERIDDALEHMEPDHRQFVCTWLPQGGALSSMFAPSLHGPH